MPKFCSEADQALYEVSCEDEVELSILEFGDETGKHLKQMGKPQFFEQTAYQVIIEKKRACTLQFDHESTLLRQSVAPVGKSGHLLAGVINFGNEIGLTDLRVLVNNHLYLTVTLEVYPTKLSYKADYLAMREDIAQEIYNLAFDFMKRTYLNAELKEVKNPSLTEFFSIFKKQFKEIIQVTDLIIRKPHHELVATEAIKNYRPGQYIGPKGIAYLNKHPQKVMKQGNNYMPQKVLHVKKQLTIDVYENQLVKSLLLKTINKLKALLLQYNRLGRQADEAFTSTIRKWIEALEQRVTGPFFSQISKLDRVMQFSIVLQMSPVYQSFYKLYLSLQKGLAITTDVFQISQKDVAQLYEYWCFIKLGSLLRKNHTLVSTDVIKIKHQELFVSLQKGKDSMLKYQNNQTGERLTLVYNQKLRSTPTVSQAPDNMLILEKELSDVAYHYVLDAKYKMDYEKSHEEHIEVPKEEDINTMHRYRDAIVSRANHQPYERKVFGSIILFPGAHETTYKQHRFYKSIHTVNIGGLPFLPSHTTLVEAFLQELIEGTGQAPYRCLPKITGWETYGKEQNIGVQDVLLGPVKSKRQLDTCLTEKLYYVPAKRVNLLNKHIEQVALYEPKGMGTLKSGGIAYVGKVSVVKNILRKEIEHLFPCAPWQREENYIVFEIEAWAQRETPIIPCGYGVSSSWYTSQTLLKYARTLPELHIKDEIELELIWKLRRTLHQLETRLDAQNQLVLQMGDCQVYVDEQGEIVVHKGDEICRFGKEVLQHEPRLIYRCLQ